MAQIKGTFSINITPPPPPPPPPLAFGVSSLPDAVVGVPYTANLGVTGGRGPYDYAVTAGSLPPGIALMSDGSFQGAPSQSGQFGFEITVTDADGVTASTQGAVKVG